MCEENEERAVAYVYCNYKERNCTASNVIASLLLQLVERQVEMPEEIKKAYQQHAKCKTRPPLGEYVSLLKQAVCRFSMVYIVIDALDECSDADGTGGFLPEIRRLPSHVRLLVTSRVVASIEAGFEGEVRLDILATDKDVEVYAAARIEESKQLAEHVKDDPGLRTLILDSTVQRARGMYG